MKRTDKEVQQRRRELRKLARLFIASNIRSALAQQGEPPVVKEMTPDEDKFFRNELAGIAYRLERE